MDQVKSFLASAVDLFSRSNLSSYSEDFLASDSYFLKDWTIFTQLHEYTYECKENIRLMAIGGRIVCHEETRKKQALFESLSHMETTIDSTMHRIFQSIQTKAENNHSDTTVKLLPRIVRLSLVLQLSYQEYKALIRILTHCLGFHGPFSNYDKLPFVRKLIEFSSMSMKDLLHFVSPIRVHVKQGLFEIDDELASDFSGASFKIPREIMSALCGNILSLDEFMKIADTEVGKLLENEPNFQGHPKAPILNIETNDCSDNELSDQKPFLCSKKDEKDNSIETDVLNELSCLNIEKDSDFNEPYSSDLCYLEDAFSFILQRMKKFNINSEDESDNLISLRQRKPEAILREVEAKERQTRTKWERKISLTLSEYNEHPKSNWLPRLEQLAMKHQLVPFEKMLILSLIGSIISQDIRNLLRNSSNNSFSTGGGSGGLMVGTLLGIHCNTLQEQIDSRKFFYKRSLLIKEGIISLSDRRLNSGDLMDCIARIDRRMLDYIVGLDTEINDLVEGGNCYSPCVDINQVVLPNAIKSLIVDTVQSFDKFADLRDQTGLNDIISYGKGLIMLFWGNSGTGKTMMANGLATHLKKKILVIDFNTLYNNSTLDSDFFRFLFREAFIQDAILFFDECEPIFEKRDTRRNGNNIGLILTELEKFVGVIILATNRPFDLDEAMYRRISLCIEFPAPDPILRERIWKNHIPKRLKVSSDIQWSDLAMDYELTGGFIKNAILQALSFAICKANKRRTNQKDLTLNDLQLESEDLRKACHLQVRGQLELVNFDKQIVPTCGLHALVLSPLVSDKLREIINFEKARKVLCSQWGFQNDDNKMMMGNNCLFYGSSGVGKSKSALAVAYETGHPIRIIVASELLRLRSNSTIENIFRDSKTAGAIVVIESAEILLSILSHPEQYANYNAVQTLLFAIREFSFITIMIATTDVDHGVQPQWFHLPILTRYFRFIVEFPRPDAKNRATLWQKLMPTEVELEENVSFQDLANQFNFTGFDIQQSIVKACTMVALTKKNGERRISKNNLIKAAEALKITIESTISSRPTFTNMYH